MTLDRCKARNSLSLVHSDFARALLLMMQLVEISTYASW